MTKKHFIALADLIKQENLRVHRDFFGTAQQNVLADFCESQSPRFDRKLWLDYIAGKNGPNGGKVQS